MAGDKGAGSTLEHRAVAFARFAAAAATSSPATGDGLDGIVAAAVACLRLGLAARAVSYADAEPEGADLLLRHGTEWLGSVSSACDVTDAVVVGDEAARGAGTRRLVVRIDGRVGALGAFVVDRDEPFGEDDTTFAVDVVGLLSMTVARWAADREVVVRHLMLEETQRHTHVGSFDWDVLTDEVHWSDEMYRLYGYAPQSFRATFEEFLRHIHPDDREKIRESVQRAYAEVRDYRMEERIVRPDGEVRMLSSWGHVIPGPDGTPVRIIGSCQDVTEARAAASALAASEARFRQLFETAPDAVLLVDAGGAVVEANEEAALLFGRTREELAASSLDDLLRSAADAGAPTVAIRPDGAEVPVDIRAATFEGADGRLTTAFVRDVSERIRVEDLDRRLRDSTARRTQALEINDGIVQGLAAAALALDHQQLPLAARALRSTLDNARSMMSDLLERAGDDLTAVEPGSLVREGPTHRAGDPSAVVAVSPELLPAGALRLVIADDSEDLRFLLRALLDPRDGFVVVGEAADGAEAVDLVARHQPDVLVVDLAMPALDGLQAITQVRALSPRTAIVVVSGLSSSGMAAKVLGLGAAAYVEKGEVATRLVDVVRAAAGGTAGSAATASQARAR